MSVEQGLRERKKQRTRQALIDAAVTLFHTKGYDNTTIAEIATAAEVAPRTFFAYFPSKEDILFADTEDRIQTALAVIDNRSPDDRPADLLLRVVDHIVESGMVRSELFRRLAPVRLDLIVRSSAVQGNGLRRMVDAQQRLAERLRQAYPEDLDELTASAVVGSFVGALLGVGMVLLGDLETMERRLADRPDEVLREVYQALEVALHGIRTLDAKPAGTGVAEVAAPSHEGGPGHLGG